MEHYQGEISVPCLVAAWDQNTILELSDQLGSLFCVFSPQTQFYLHFLSKIHPVITHLKYTTLFFQNLNRFLRIIINKISLTRLRPYRVTGYLMPIPVYRYISNIHHF